MASLAPLAEHEQNRGIVTADRRILFSLPFAISTIIDDLEGENVRLIAS